MDDPHADQPVETAGAPLAAANAAVLLFHGRGAAAAGMLDISAELAVDGIAFLALQARRGTWYPNSFMAPIESNEPWLSSALAAVDTLSDRVGEAGISPAHTVFLGFSQGACLAAEYVARNARPYGGLAVLSGGLIGPDGTDFAYEGDLEGSPVFLGCSDADPHIPVSRVHETRQVFEARGGDVTERIYEGMGHTVNRDELDAVAAMIRDARSG